MSDPCSPDCDGSDFKRKALRDACLFMGWVKLVSVGCYISIYYLIKFNTEGEFMFVLQMCLLSGIVPSMLLGILLCDGAYNKNVASVGAGFAVCLFLATYDLIIGILGTTYVMIIANNGYHFLMTMAFLLLTLTSIPAYCHDAFIINSYRKALTIHAKSLNR